MTETKLLQSLQSVQRRMMTIGMGAGAGWAVAAILGLVMLFAWADLALDLAPRLRIACLILCIPAGLLLLLRGGWLSLRGARPRAVARRIDHVGNTGGQILSGVDLLQQYRGTVATATLSGQLAALAVERAADLAARVRSAAAAPANPLIWPYAALGALLVVIGVLALSTPRLLAAQWARFTDPYGDHPPYSAIELKVEPGDTRVVYGSSLDVRVTPTGGAVDGAQLVFDADGQSQESVPMFPEPGGTWRATVSQVTAGGVYFVRAGRARSHKFRFDVITVPELREVRVRITPPAYTHLPPYSGPVPDRGISGLAGTKVEIWAKSNRPLSGGVIAVTPSSEASPTQPAVASAPSSTMSPVEAGASEVTGSLVIASAGKLSVSVVDTANQPCREPFTTSITVLKDLRPFVRILEPKENSFATPDAKLEVNLAAEDDYGISSLQLFRGLNDTRATAASVPVPANQPTRLSASIPFDLSGYGLTPGDVVKFYARVEDNDPAGPKGSESPVVTLHIISNEDFNRMAVAREGLETLEARYSMAERLLEGFDDRLKKLQDDLKKTPPDSPLAREKQEQIKKLAREMKDAADEVNEAARDELPFDADKEFRKKLADIAKAMGEAADDTDAAAKEGLSSAKAGEKLAAVRKKLGKNRDDFKKDVTQPLDNLDKIFPLIEDQERFVEIWRRQQDLADRMKSLVGVNAEDPKVKGRMRDLETEQRQLVTDLNDLLNDIRNHAIRLPIVGRPLVRADYAEDARLALARRSGSHLSGTRWRKDTSAGSSLLTGETMRTLFTGALSVADDPKGDDDKQLKDTLEELQKTAFDFIAKVRHSGAFEQMNESATGLGAFDGVHAAGKAQEAADTLKKFISECQGTEGKLRGLCVLVFRPNIAHAMDNTIGQLLDAEGMNPGGGTGASGGFSQRRSTLRNSSLYGRVPSRSHGGGDRSGKNAAGPGASGSPMVGDNSNLGGVMDEQKLRASGESDVAVPPQYKRKVGEYFQRAADELGQE